VLLAAGIQDITDIRQKLIKAGINPLMIPAEFFSVNAIPKLGTGKTDFSALKKLAGEMIH